uniref:Uncharacterized protein n=1 Tax=Bionectria ochroleuca TaxID=29856 RepID=A0A8H7TTW3_BIOOC
MTAQGDRYHMEGGLVYVGEGTDQMIIPQMGAPHPDGRLLVCGAGVPLDHTRPWCELCKIPFDEKDEIVRYNSGGFLSPRFTCDKKKIRYVPFEGNPKNYGASFLDTLPHPFRHSFHPECVEDGFKAGVLPSVLDKVAYSYVPTVTEFKRRLRWLHQELSNDLARHHGALTGYLAYKTAGHCLSLLITALSMSTKEYNDAAITSFRVDGDIWARLVKFEGKDRVVKLRKPEGLPTALYVAFDYLGIRKLIVGVDDDEPPSISPEDGLWWFTMKIDGDSFTCQSDGMKLRKMRPGAAVEFPTLSYCWSAPQEVDNVPFLYPIQTDDFSTPMRVKFVEFNSPSVTGYSVRWTSQLASFHAHTRGEEDFAFYDEFKGKPQRAVWVYMPMDEGELMDEVWLRSDQESSQNSIILVMKTNQGRVWEAGPRPDPANGPNISWARINQSTESERFFFSASYSGISELGFSSPLPAPGLGPEVPFPEVPLPKSAPEEPLGPAQRFYTCAPLDGVASVSICKKKKARQVMRGRSRAFRTSPGCSSPMRTAAREASGTSASTGSKDRLRSAPRMA